jgi:hypothetical protein
MDSMTLDLEGRVRVMCTQCLQSKPAEAFYVVRGSLAEGDWRAQPCADCCRHRVAREYAVHRLGRETVGGNGHEPLIRCPARPPEPDPSS